MCRWSILHWDIAQPYLLQTSMHLLNNLKQSSVDLFVRVFHFDLKLALTLEVVFGIFLFGQTAIIQVRKTAPFNLSLVIIVSLNMRLLAKPAQLIYINLLPGLNDLVN